MSEKLEKTKPKSGRKERPPENPYIAARREWNERYGSFVSQAKNWRMIAFGTTAVAIIAVGGLVGVSLQHKVVPYAVELNGHGETVRVVRADVLERPNANQIRAGLRSWIMGARATYRDPEALQLMINTTYAMTIPDSDAYRELASYHRANDPYRRAARGERVKVDVTAVVPISSNTWQVEWRETTRQGNDEPVERNYQASITVLISPPTDEEQLMINPMGIYVDQFAWTRRL